MVIHLWCNSAMLLKCPLGALFEIACPKISWLIDEYFILDYYLNKQCTSKIYLISTNLPPVCGSDII